MAIFQGNDNSIFRERKEFCGSILKQLSEAYHFLDFFNKTKKSIFMGASQSRNPNLANVFCKGLNLVESYGTGVRKINRLYKDYDEKPLFQTAEGVFSVTLPNQNNVILAVKEQPATFVYNQDVKTEILNYIKAKKKITRKDIENEFGFGTTKAFTLLKELGCLPI